MLVKLVLPVILILSSACLAITVIPGPDYFSIFIDRKLNYPQNIDKEDIENDTELDKLNMALQEYESQNEEIIDSIWRDKVTEDQNKQEAQKQFLNPIKNLELKQENTNDSDILPSKIDKKHFLDHIKNLQMKQANSNMIEMLRGKKNNQEEMVKNFLERIRSIHLRQANANRWNMLRRKMLRKKDIQKAQDHFLGYMKNKQAKLNMLLMLRGKKNNKQESLRELENRSGVNWSNSNIKILEFLRRKMLRKKDDKIEEHVQFMKNIKDSQMKQANYNMINMLRGKKDYQQDLEDQFLDDMKNPQMEEAHSNMWDYIMWEMFRGKRDNKQDLSEDFLHHMKNLQMKQANSNMWEMLRGKKDNKHVSGDRFLNQINNLQMKQAADNNFWEMLRGIGKKNKEYDSEEHFLSHLNNIQMKPANSNMWEKLWGKNEDQEDSQEQQKDANMWEILLKGKRDSTQHSQDNVRDRKKRKRESEKQFLYHIKNCQLRQKMKGKGGKNKESNEKSSQCAARMSLRNIKKLQLKQATSNMFQMLRGKRESNKKHYNLLLDLDWLMLEGNQRSPMDLISKLVKTHQIHQASSNKQKKADQIIMVSLKENKPIDILGKNKNNPDKYINTNGNQYVSIMKENPIDFSLIPNKNFAYEDNLEDSKNSAISETDLDTKIEERKRSPLWWMKLRPVYRWGSLA